MVLTLEQDQQFQQGLQAVEQGLISSDYLLQCVHIWLSSSGSSLAEVVFSQSELSNESLATLQQVFASSQSAAVLQPTEAPQRPGEYSPYSKRQLDRLQAALDEEAGLDRTTSYHQDSGTPEGAEWDRLVQRARQSEANRFRIDRFLDKGGLGAVFQATDLQLNRQVAIKRIADHRSASEVTRVKFFLEAEITGQLEHPGIVPIYALGTDHRQEPYYAMRLIPGDTLRRVIKEFHQRMVDHPGCFDSLEFRGLLRRFVDVCNAIEYAHSRGVLHRDLKPGNIMIGAHGETLVVDWGLAKVLQQNQPTTDPGDVIGDQLALHSDTAHTIDGSFIGTARYAAPEQLAGKIDKLDPRTDIYALGAVLYELLCGRPPLDTNNHLVALDAINTGQLQPPRAILATVPRPLEAICCRAMMIAAESRYSSARMLAEDVERWLADVRVLAYTDEPIIERIGRWLRHHRTWTVAIATSLLLVSSITLVAALIINRARRDERLARQTAQAFQQEAIARYGVAKTAVDTLVERANTLAETAGTQAVLQSILEEAARNYEVLGQNESLDPVLEIERVRALVRLADVQELLGRSGEADRTYSRAIGQLEQSLGALAMRPPINATSIQVKQAIELARAIDRYGWAQHNSVRHEEARRNYERAIAIYAAWSQADRQNATLAGNWAIALTHLGQLDLEAGQPASALDSLQQSVGLFATAHAVHDQFMQPVFALAEISSKELLGRTLRRLGEHDEARLLFQQSIQACDQFLEKNPANIRYQEQRITTLISIASTNQSYGDWQVAWDNLRTARPSIERLLQEFPDSFNYRQWNAVAALDEGGVLLELGRVDEAVSYLSSAQQLLDDLSVHYPGMDRQRLCSEAHGVLGRALSEQSCPNAEAEKCLTDAIEIMQATINAARSTLPPDSPQSNPVIETRPWELQLARQRSHLARYLGRAGQPDTARAEFAMAIQSMTKCLAESIEPLQTQIDLAHTLWHSGQLEHAQGDRTTAREQFELAITLWNRLLAEEELPTYQYYLAICLADCPDQSLRNLKQAQQLASRCATSIPSNPQFTKLAERLK